MYLPKSKYKILYASKKEVRFPNGEYYTGPYVKTYDGQIFSGEKLSKDSKRLIEIPTGDQPETLPDTVEFLNESNPPTEKDYQRGKFKRFFLQDKRNNQIIEVKRQRFNLFKRLAHINSKVVDWILEGPATDTKKGPYIYFGAASKNKETIIKAENTIKGLTQLINNYGEFVR